MNFYAEALVQQAQAALDEGVLTGLAKNRVALVARGDVAAAAAGILIGDGRAGTIYKATSPERMSAAERAALIAEITGRPPRAPDNVLAGALKSHSAGAGQAAPAREDA
ncbi:MAG TPA: hypothetical protein VEU96_29740 [Bryobacteraceae bacterium]|nr:hypothetical protein [Bryobacteraceae bacterium]